MLPANYAINPSPLPISAAGVGIPSLPSLLLLLLLLLQLWCLCPRKCGITLWLVPTTFQASPPPPLPPPAITYPALQYQGITSSSSSCWSPYPFHLLFLLQCGSFPTFLPWCLLGVSALTGWSRAGPITPEFTDGTPHNTLLRAAGLPGS